MHHAADYGARGRPGRSLMAGSSIIAQSSSSAAVPPEREALAGLVERVTLHNAETGFCVLRAKVRGQRELMTAGAAAPIGDGEFVQAVPITCREPPDACPAKPTGPGRRVVSQFEI